jgi:aldose 1-epimerase
VRVSGPGAGVERFAFGRTREGEPVEGFRIAGGGLRATLLGYGATLAALEVPDRRGVLADVVLGFATLAGYEGSAAHLGGVVGRFANRIAGARFVLDGVEHRLTANEGRHHLHGGARGFDRRVWRGEPLADQSGVAFALESADGEEGYPGRLRCRAVYRIRGPGTLAVELEATADRATPVSLTQHAYWNLGGPPGGPVREHRLTLLADRYLAVDAEHVPTGLRAVAGTPFDFRAERALGPAPGPLPPELALFGGYDHPFALRGGEGALRLAARLVEPASGRALEIDTTAPCLQLYGGQFLAETPGKAGWRHGPGRGLCLEAQRFPDAPNRPELPSAILRPGELHRQETRYRFAAG